MAHNHEVARSKRVSGILLFVSFIEVHSQCSSDFKPVQLHYYYTLTLFTGVAQRERAGLITPRSLVQTQSPVFSYSSSLLCYRTIPQLLAGVIRSRPSFAMYATLNIMALSPVWRSGSALLNTVLFLYTNPACWYDLRMVMDYTPEVVGSKPTTGIPTFFLPHSFSLLPLC